MRPGTHPSRTAALDEDHFTIPLPLLPLEDRVVFPRVVLPIAIPDGELTARLEQLPPAGRLVVLACPGRDGDNPEGFLPLGTLGRVLRLMRMKDGSVRLLIQGLERVRLGALETGPGCRLCRPQAPAEDQHAPEAQGESLHQTLLLLFHELIELSPALSEDLAAASEAVGSTSELTDFIAANLELPLEEKRQLLLACRPLDRARQLIEIMVREKNLIELGRQIQSKVRSQLDREQREYYLREQLRVIQRELGDEDPRDGELDELSRTIREAGLPPEAQEAARRELERLGRLPSSSGEYQLCRTYLDWLAHLPWQRRSPDRLEIRRARQVLDEDHCGLEEVKERIIQYLAVRALKADSRGPLLCLVGPPGVGKTSLGKSIARALGREFGRLSLGGVRDEAEIRGHRRTYIGAMPGRLLQLLRRLGVNNPVVMLDELDKLGAEASRSDPANALLEVLDPAQNGAFSDHYLEIGFDLSQVFFIATANLFHQIPAALRDRLERIELSGYTPGEKLQIARRHLLPRQLEEHGLSADQLELPDEALAAMIARYTRESGVRELGRELATIARVTALRLLEEGGSGARVTTDELESYLGPARYLPESAGQSPEVGVATGLAWTACGGEILFVEALLTGERPGLELTGQLGEVMKESALAALSYLSANRERYGLGREALQRGIHLHVPSGATPKDGPSAGLAMAAALASLLSGRPVRHDTAMTGEITLRGRVLPVGGVREKILAAHRAGIRRVILPRDNRKDLLHLPAEAARELEFVFADGVEQALEQVLCPVESRVTGIGGES